jgi:hypothetical protein
MPTGSSDAVAAAPVEVPDVAALEADGRWLEVIEQLTEANRRQPDPDLEVRLARARHRAFAQVASAPAPSTWPPPVDDLFAGVVGTPEVPVTELTSERLTSAIAHHGCLRVNGLLSPERVAQLTEDVERAFEGFDAYYDATVGDDPAPWFTPCETVEPWAMDPFEQILLRKVGGVHTGDSPRALFDLCEALDETGVSRVIGEHLGERPVLSLNKGVLRTMRDAAPNWHQDGCYLGTDIRAVNLWVTLSDCGGDTGARGLDLVPRRIDRLLPGGTHGLDHPNCIAHEVVADAAGEAGWQRPFFAAGDAILFDQLFVHSTDKRPGIDDVRYAIESWFFTASTLPDNQIPLVV